MSEWWAGLPDAEAEVGCGGEMHTLRWHAGRLHAVDHEDVEGERALAALGGERCTCVDVLDAWARHTDDLRVLTLSSRGAGDQLAVQVDWPGSKRGRRSGVAIASRSSGWTAYPPGGPGMSSWEDAEDELVPLLGLGGGLVDRLVASVMAAWSVRIARDEPEVSAARGQLSAALYGRAGLAIRAWLAEASLSFELDMIDAGAQPRLVRLDSGAVRAELPFSWLSTAWARGLATLWGRFCLGVETRDGVRWTLSTLASDLRQTQLITIELKSHPPEERLPSGTPA